MDGLDELSKIAEPEELEISAKNRKVYGPDLKVLIQKQHITSYRSFLSDFKQVKDLVGNLHGELGELNKICGNMATNLWVSKQNSRNLIDEISKLESERKKLIGERDIAQAYLNAFQLNGDDLRILRHTENSTGVLSEEFFEVFEKIQKIQANVNILLKVGHSTTAVEIMDQMGLFQVNSDVFPSLNWHDMNALLFLLLLRVCRKLRWKRFTGGLRCSVKMLKTQSCPK